MNFSTCVYNTKRKTPSTPSKHLVLYLVCKAQPNTHQALHFDKRTHILQNPHI